MRVYKIITLRLKTKTFINDSSISKFKLEKQYRLFPGNPLYSIMEKLYSEKAGDMESNLFNRQYNVSGSLKRVVPGSSIKGLLRYVFDVLVLRELVENDIVRKECVKYVSKQYNKLNESLKNLLRCLAAINDLSCFLEKEPCSVTTIKKEDLCSYVDDLRVKLYNYGINNGYRIVFDKEKRPLMCSSCAIFGSENYASPIIISDFRVQEEGCETEYVLITRRGGGIYVEALKPGCQLIGKVIISANPTTYMLKDSIINAWKFLKNRAEAKRSRTCTEIMDRDSDNVEEVLYYIIRCLFGIAGNEIGLGAKKSIGFGRFDVEVRE